MGWAEETIYQCKFSSISVPSLCWIIKIEEVKQNLMWYISLYREIFNGFNKGLIIEW